MSYKVSFPKYEEVDGKFVLPENVQILSLKESDYRLQQETIPHFRDDKSNFTTQLRNLIIADLNPSNEKTYKIDGNNYSGNEVSTLYQKLIVEDLKITVRLLTSEDIKTRKLPNQIKGLVVTKIENDSPLKNTTLAVNHIITEAQKKKIRSVNDLHQAIKKVLNTKVTLNTNPSKISSPGLSIISVTVPWQKFKP